MPGGWTLLDKIGASCSGLDWASRKFGAKRNSPIRTLNATRAAKERSGKRRNCFPLATENSSPPCRRRIRRGLGEVSWFNPPEVPPCARGDVFMVGRAAQRHEWPP